MVLLDQQTNAGKRKIAGTIVAERILDVIVLAGDARGHRLRDPARRRAAHRPADPDHGHRRGASRRWLAVVFQILRRRGALTRLRDLIRPLPTPPARWPGRQGLPLLAGIVVLWICEGAVYLAVAKAVELDISATGALYLVALTNFAAALPAAPGSIGTFDAAVAFGAGRSAAAASVVISYLLLLRFVLYVPITAVGLVFLVVRYGGWARLRSALSVQKTQAERRLGPQRSDLRPQTSDERFQQPKRRQSGHRASVGHLRRRRGSAPDAAGASSAASRCRRSRCCSRPRPPTTRGPGSCGAGRSRTSTWSPRAARRGSRCRCSSPRRSRCSARTLAPYAVAVDRPRRRAAVAGDGVPPRRAA